MTLSRLFAPPDADNAPAAEIVDVIVYDVGGTLLDAYDRLNVPVYNQLMRDIAAAEDGSGLRVEIRTAGSVKGQQKKLIKAITKALSESGWTPEQVETQLKRLPPVQKKDDLKGKTVRVAYDDYPGLGFQPYNAIRWVHADTVTASPAPAARPKA